MKGYNFLRIGADLVNARNAADEQGKRDQSLQDQRAERQSSIEANNALRDLRQKQAGQIDAKEAEEKAMREALGGIDLGDPRAVPVLLQHGNAELANRVFQYQNQQKEAFLTSLGGAAEDILKLPPEQHAEAAKRWLESQAKIDPSWSRFAGMPVTTDDLRAIAGRTKDLLAQKPKPGQKWIQLADKRWVLANPDGTINDPQGPAAAPTPNTAQASLDYRKNRDAKKDADDAAKRKAELKAAYDTVAKMSDKERAGARLMNSKFADLEAKAEQYRNEFMSKAPASQPVKPSAPAKPGAFKWDQPITFDKASSAQRDKFWALWRKAQAQNRPEIAQQAIVRYKKDGLIK